MSNPKIELLSIKLKRNFDFEILKKVKRDPVNEIYFRGMFWINNNLETISHFPSKTLLSELTVDEPFFRLKRDIEYGFRNGDVYNLEGREPSEGLVLYNPGQSKINSITQELSQLEKDIQSLTIYHNELTKIYENCCKENQECKNSSILMSILKTQYDLKINKSQMELKKEKLEKARDSLKEVKKINIILQIRENDRDLVRRGEEISSVASSTKEPMTSWSNLINEYHKVQMEQIKSLNPNFNPATVLNPKFAFDAIYDGVAKGIIFIGNILKANDDEIIYTYIGEFENKQNDQNVKIDTSNVCFSFKISF